MVSKNSSRGINETPVRVIMVLGVVVISFFNSRYVWFDDTDINVLPR